MSRVTGSNWLIKSVCLTIWQQGIQPELHKMLCLTYMTIVDALLQQVKAKEFAKELGFKRYKQHQWVTIYVHVSQNIIYINRTPG